MPATYEIGMAAVADLRAQIANASAASAAERAAREKKFKRDAEQAGLAIIKYSGGLAAPFVAIGLVALEGLVALSNTFGNGDSQTWVDRANDLVAEHLRRGLIPGAFLGSYVDARRYTQTLGDWGLDRLDASPSAVRASVAELGALTLQHAREPAIQIVAEAISKSQAGEVSNVAPYLAPSAGHPEYTDLSLFHLPALLAGTVAALDWGSPLLATQDVAIDAHRSFVARRPDVSQADGSPFYAAESLADAWESAKAYARAHGAPRFVRGGGQLDIAHTGELAPATSTTAVVVAVGATAAAVGVGWWWFAKHGAALLRPRRRA